MANRTGQQLGNYQLIRTLAEGGFAEVYLGEHIHLGTTAAIKVLHTQLTNEDLEQFRAEARNIARLQHPHIVAVLDFDVQEDIPFLVMEYAPNGTLRQRHPKGLPLPPTTILPYLRQIAEALRYAHAEQLIHRDVKPENMLIGRYDEILLSDFGIAVAASSTTRDIVGTPAYMAPEQLQGKPIPASDQYALGIVAYEWLCGTPPFKGTFSEVAAQHLNVPPPSLCERAPNLSPTLDKVVQKALAKNPQQRYISVLEFVNALEAATQLPSLHLFGAAVSSNPSQTLYLQPTILVTPPSTPSPLLSQEASQLVDLPTKKYSNKQYNKYLTSRRTVLLGLAGLAATLVAGTSIARLIGFSHPAKTAPTPTPIPEGTTLHSYYGHFGYVYAVAWSPDGTTIASGSEDHSVHIWDIKTAADILYTYSNHGDGVHAVAWSPDGTAIATASADKTVQVWKTSDESSIYTYSGHKDTVNAAAWSPDGTTIASASTDKTVQVWHATDGSSAYLYKKHNGPVNTLAWSPDGTLLASGSADKTVHIWKVADGSDILTYSNHSDSVNTLAWSPDGTLLASGSADKTVHIWNAADGSDILIYSNHTDAVNTLAWSPDGTLLASGSADKTVHIWTWKVADGSDIFTYSNHTDAVNVVAWSPDGTLLASGSNDKTVLVWQA